MISPRLVIIPTYNEKENVKNIINATLELKPDFDILIVDDSSPDGTGEIVKALIKENKEGRIHILERKEKEGLGRAYIAGFRWALDHGYEYIFEMDADFSHDPLKLIELFNALDSGADVSIGSRYIEGGKLENWPLNRILLSKGASIYVRAILGMPVKDPTSGFVGYKAQVLKTLDLDTIQFVGYAFQIEMKYKAHYADFVLKEVPITFKDRELGKSKMSMAIAKEALVGVWRMKWS